MWRGEERRGEERRGEEMRESGADKSRYERREKRGLNKMGEES